MKNEIPSSAVTYANRAIGKDVKRLREEAGLSQAEVARAAKVRPEMLCRIESGKGNPTVATIAKIVKALKKLSRTRVTADR